MRPAQVSKDKTVGDLGREAFWFLTHTLLAVAVLAVVIGVMSLMHPDPESSAPKLLGTLLAFFVPMVGGFAITRVQQNDV